MKDNVYKGIVIVLLTIIAVTLAYRTFVQHDGEDYSRYRVDAQGLIIDLKNKTMTVPEIIDGRNDYETDTIR